MTVVVEIPDDVLAGLCADADELRAAQARERATKRATHRLLQLEDDFGQWHEVLLAVVDASRVME